MLGRLSRWVGRFALDLLLTPVDLVEIGRAHV